MKIGITGATGFIGRHLLAAARNAGHDVVGFSREPRPRAGFVEMRAWQPIAEADFSGLDALIHLAGENLLGRWSQRKREAIRRTRVDDTLTMISRLRALPRPPRVLVCAGGTAYYGNAGEAELPESAPAGQGFISEVARAWEDAALQAADFTRVVSLRTGMVLGADGGAGVVLRRIFRLCLGGKFGSGRQWSPWIHISDLARLYLFAAECEALRGAVNAVAPGAVRNRDFTRAVAGALHRPAFLPAPAFILKRLPGGMGDIFLHSQRVIPAVATEAGFTWLFPEITGAAQDVFARQS